METVTIVIKYVVTRHHQAHNAHACGVRYVSKYLDALIAHSLSFLSKHWNVIT